jgi:hypothetical protein
LDDQAGYVFKICGLGFSKFEEPHGKIGRCTNMLDVGERCHDAICVVSFHNSDGGRWSGRPRPSLLFLSLIGAYYTVRLSH